MVRRRLSPEERDLWRKVAATTIPLRGAASPPAPDPQPHEASSEASLTRPDPPAPVSRPLSLRPQPAGTAARVTLDLAPDPHEALAGAQPLMDRRRFDKMRRGRLEPEARLDLHGMTAERAHAALHAFVHAAHASGLRLVLVITGKGRAGFADALAPQRHGVLRHSLPHWLAAAPLGRCVLQIAPAHHRHGGGGAFYVYLRRRR